MTKPIADRIPIYVGDALGFLAFGLGFHALLAPGFDLAAGMAGAFTAVFPTGLELAAILPGIVAALENTLFEQGSVIVADSDGTGIWTHELGHSLFGFWDY